MGEEDAPQNPQQDDPHPWWLRTVVYGIQVSAFADADGDGLGDLRGVVDHLDHVASLGVDSIWLTPTYVSSDRDNGYDIVDHRRIDERFGGDDALDAVIRAAEERGLRVILELVGNHTSDQHPWFLASRGGIDVPERRRYVWRRDPAPEPTTPGFPGPETAVWTYDELTDEWYRHLFYAFEPDLDVDDPVAQEDLATTLRHWAERGVAGFRLDAAGPMVNRPYRATREDHRPIRHLAGVARSLERPVPILGEADVPPEEYASFFDDGDQVGLLFDFYASAMLFLALARRSAEPIARLLERLPKPPPGTAYLNFLRNLDELNLDRLDPTEQTDVCGAFAADPTMKIYERGIRRRVASMLGGDGPLLRLAWSLLFALPGVPLLTYGDEIGLGEDLAMPERWSVRTTMQWTDGANAGYSTARGDHVVRPPRADGAFGYRRVNVAAQDRDPRSLLAWFRGLVRARCSTPELGWAPWTVVDVGAPSVSAVVYDGDQGPIAVFHNLADEAAQVVVPANLRDVELRTVFPGNGPTERLGEWFELPGLAYRWLATPRG